MVGEEGNKKDMARRSNDTALKGDEDASSIDCSEKRLETALDADEEKSVGLAGAVNACLKAPQEIAHRDQQDPTALLHDNALRPTKSHRSYGGEDGYTCFNEQDAAPNNSTRVTGADEPFLVSWDGGEADPANPRSMSSARRWAITLIVSASSLCVCVVWFWVTFPNADFEG